MNKIIVAFAVAGVTFGTFAGPRGHGCGHRPPPPPVHHHDGWGRGGRNFWPGFVGGLVGGIVANAVTERETVVVQQTPAVVTQPVVVQQPVMQTQNVWVEGCYVDQVQANGTVVRVWNPGHYEQRTVVAQ